MASAKLTTSRKQIPSEKLTFQRDWCNVLLNESHTILSNSKTRFWVKTSRIPVLHKPKCHSTGW